MTIFKTQRTCTTKKRKVIRRLAGRRLRDVFLGEHSSRSGGSCSHRLHRLLLDVVCHLLVLTATRCELLKNSNNCFQGIREFNEIPEPFNWLKLSNNTFVGGAPTSLLCWFASAVSATPLLTAELGRF